MTYTSRSDALEFKCPNCGADTGGKCVGARGKKRESVHRERMNVAARELNHAPIATFSLVGDRLTDAEGNVLGRLTNVEFDLQSEELTGNLRRGEEEVGVDVPPELPSPPPGRGAGEPVQGAMLPDPVNEVWDHYIAALERPKAVLAPKVRRWISDAISAVGAEECRRAITGLAASDHHRVGGYIGIEYALRPKQGETIEGRVAMMAAKAPSSGNGPTTVQRLLSRLPSETHGMVRGWIADVEAMLRNPDHTGLSATGEGALGDLRTKAHMEPVIENGRIVDWKDLKR